MSAFVIVDMDVPEPSVYAEYELQVSASVAAYGGRYLAVGGRTERLEGDWLPKRLVILEFESLAMVRQWWNSPEYQPLKELRRRAAHTNMVAIEGL